MEQEFASILLESAVTELSRLPGVGRKTALRLALHILRQDESVGVALGEAIINMRRGVKYCSVCHNISETEVCPICSSPARDKSTVCVVESVKDVMIFENTRQYRGLYHVLGGVISPMDGIGPSDLEIESLIARVQTGDVREVILALPTTMEGDTTNFYIYRRLKGVQQANDLQVSQIARGVAIGNELEYTDEITLGRSIVNRIEFKI